MNAVHANQLVKGLSVLGCGFGTVLLAYGVATSQQHVLTLALVLFAISAVAALVAYWIGDPIEQLLPGAADVPFRLIEEYEEAAFAALVVMAMLGLIGAVWLFLYGSRDVPLSLAVFALTVSVFALALLAWTAHLGARIRQLAIHPQH